MFAVSFVSANHCSHRRSAFPHTNSYLPLPLGFRSDAMLPLLVDEVNCCFRTNLPPFFFSFSLRPSGREAAARISRQSTAPRLTFTAWLLCFPPFLPSSPPPSVSHAINLRRHTPTTGCHHAALRGGFVNTLHCLSLNAASPPDLAESVGLIKR